MWDISPILSYVGLLLNKFLSEKISFYKSNPRLRLIFQLIFWKQKYS